MLRGLKTFCLFFIAIKVYSQPFVYSKDYFRWPVAAPPAIVANFGELRSNHWHMGLDVRTNQRVNMPVVATADGYISRVSVRPFGFGQAIYISHPNGLTTVYGHLNKFFPKLENFITQEQEKQHSWEIELNLTKTQFPVKKGQFIAYSGSTGSSQGPHVHFEIRNTQTERCINPLFFDLPLPDNVPPTFTKLGMYNGNKSIYDQTPLIYPVKKRGLGYFLKDSIIKTGFSKLFFAIGALDHVSKSANPIGIYGARIKFDGQTLIEFALDSMDYDETEYVNAHIDYKYTYNGNSYLQLLSLLPGNKSRAYRNAINDGVITLNDTTIHTVRIEIMDLRHHISVLNFKIKHDESLAAQLGYPSRKMVAPNYVTIFEQEDFELYLPEFALYDSMQPFFSRTEQALPNSISKLFRFSDASIPTHGQLTVRIKPDVVIPDLLRNKIVVRRTDGRNTSIKKAEWQQDWLAAKFSDFGSYQAFTDNTPPTVNGLGTADTIDLSRSTQLVFYPKDNSGMEKFEAELDDQWLMFTNDKGAAWVYSFDERCPYGVHHLKIRLEDLVGNSTEKEWWFKRYPGAAVKIKKGSKKKANTTKPRHVVKKTTAKKK